jgi:hypothetical protein
MKTDHLLYSPVVRFFAVDGSQVECTEFIRRHPAGFAIGQQVEVLYDRTNFKRARSVKSKWDRLWVHNGAGSEHYFGNCGNPRLGKCRQVIVDIAPPVNYLSRRSSRVLPRWRLSDKPHELT